MVKLFGKLIFRPFGKKIEKNIPKTKKSDFWQKAVISFAI
jgi:hypothetical protein